MAAAVEAADLGLSVAVRRREPGARRPDFPRVRKRAAGDPALRGDYAAGLPLIRAFRAARIDYRPATTLWHLEPEAGLLSVLAGGATAEIAASRVLLATGAQERPVPIPGWTLPGVMTAGAAQTLLKTAGAVPAGRTVLAGQGPLLLLLAAQLIRAGAPPALLLETTPRGRLAEAWNAGAPAGRRAAAGQGPRPAGRDAPHARASARSPACAPRATAGSSASSGTAASADCDTLLLHEGVVPATHVPLALGLAHDWDPAQRCWRPRVDALWRSLPARVAIAGDGAGIGGWQAADQPPGGWRRWMPHAGSAGSPRRASPGVPGAARPAALRRWRCGPSSMRSTPRRTGSWPRRTTRRWSAAARR